MAVPYEMLLHPELLTNEQLIQIIEERHLRVSNMESIPRHELLEIFHNYCVPYGQRKYRDTGRGKLLNKTRQTSPEPKSALNNNNHCRKLSQPWPTERLKPPPDQVPQQTVHHQNGKGNQSHGLKRGFYPNYIL
ncbi:ashwin-like isoform X2 [Galleria mellonella]|uniref:Ashwin n=1 Tax=Galleria mellonella TaxID=7137 RepID=A0A6J1WNR6_GALME|nr:ashwin-like isoform X2 [Galleria mellonella]